MNQVVEAATLLMRQRHETIEGADDFTVTSQEATLDAATEVSDTLTIFLGGIAGISLAVGGIGIMNIMLTTVTERAHEIGLRKALGAKRNDILMQFLVESTVLSFSGGLIGVAVGLFSTFILLPALPVCSRLRPSATNDTTSMWRDYA